jgi:hypothetical protein
MGIGGCDLRSQDGVQVLLQAPYFSKAVSVFREARKGGMMYAWEYRIGWVGRPGESFAKIQRRLDEYGAEGWEWIYQTHSQSGELWAYFKRPLDGMLIINGERRDISEMTVQMNPEHVEALKEAFGGTEVDDG